ncbi:MAG: hypothetical protein HY425_00020 [Candidatus Levybacteria bacterium]|nr:hypothetical protein [Candidatus Levybacteria bacterium]
MNIEPLIFFDMIATILILIVMLIGILFYSFQKTKKLRGTDQADAAAKIIDDAKNKALDIVTKASMSADAVSENFNEQAAKTASGQIKQLEKTTAEFTKLYAKVLHDLQLKNIEVLQNVSKDIQASALEEIGSFRNSVEKLTVASEALVKRKIDYDYETVKKEVKSYKENELKKIDNGIYTLLEETSRLVLGKALNLSEHEGLIIKSLEKAKKEGAFE